MQEKNMQKYENYREQNERLKKALANNFYLEAIFIEYSIMEDRAESVLKYTNDMPKPRNEGGFVSIDAKLSKIKKLAENKKSVIKKYFTDEFIDSIISWKNDRNGYIHALMKKQLTTEELKDYAELGAKLSKDFCRISTNYKRALEKKNLLVV